MASNHSSLEKSLDSFGPGVLDGFDFTVLFENTILSIVPSVLLLLALPFRVYFLYGRPRKVTKSFLYENKLVSGQQFLYLHQLRVDIPSLPKPIL